MSRRQRNQSLLRMVRESLGLSQEEFAKKLGCSKAYIQAMELGVRGMSLEVASALSDRYGVKLSGEGFDAEWGEAFAEKWRRDPQGAGFQLQAWEATAFRWRLNKAEEDFEKHLLLRLRALIATAVEGGCAPTVLSSLRQWLDHTTGAFGLGQRVEKFSSASEQANPRDRISGILDSLLEAEAENVQVILPAGSDPKPAKPPLAFTSILGPYLVEQGCDTLSPTKWRELLQAKRTELERSVQEKLAAGAGEPSHNIHPLVEKLAQHARKLEVLAKLAELTDAPAVPENVTRPTDSPDRAQKRPARPLPQELQRVIRGGGSKKLASELLARSSRRTGSK